ncbi:molybdopterin-dependent oxidoreductase [Spirosoma validum]|uniref:Molybdopterin-dependent oxidoreductase n=1 Tax=Spirosoma validum TaxID=2771355 RepID=A0A927B4N3_9BACT|nr:molybdopterin-dependent oxidoreductase [Spirosoma validum]MBD2755177.1 molybdopterin-dependent oxidoreductase [Spirosoma validum]
MNNLKQCINSVSQIAAALTFCFILLALHSQAQTVLTISGEVTKPLTLQAADLKGMPHTDVTAKDHDEKEHRYSGVPLSELLKQAGVTLGSQLRGKNLRKYLVVKASDDYEAVFALPELDPEFATRTILLVDSVDGQPLAKDVGPYRVVVPGEKKMARWVRQVNVLDVRVAN